MGMFREDLKRKAIAHHDRMLKENKIDIENAIKATRIYDRSTKLDPVLGETTNIKLVNKDTVSAAFDCAYTDKVTVLNFASFKNPGGFFLGGSRAQEEALCHESCLYEVLTHFDGSYYKRNRNNTNYGLYYDRLLYSKGVWFEHNYDERYLDVITCAAPNLKAIDYHPEHLKRNSPMLDLRTDFVVSVASTYQPDVLILGAWGCGVFEQSPKEVAECFLEALTKYKIKSVVFAVPGQDDNYFSFREAILHE
ncbi:MAG: TIGR02452 family protein [Lachnospiraceae bacterium]|nr:TIGR02452 family protein [Lachnospiraceae bacterium]